MIIFKKCYSLNTYTSDRSATASKRTPFMISDLNNWVLTRLMPSSVTLPSLCALMDTSTLFKIKIMGICWLWMSIIKLWGLCPLKVMTLFISPYLPIISVFATIQVDLLLCMECKIIFQHKFAIFSCIKARVLIIYANNLLILILLFFPLIKMWCLLLI